MSGHFNYPKQTHQGKSSGGGAKGSTSNRISVLVKHTSFKQHDFLLRFIRHKKIRAKLTFCAASADPDSRALIFFWRS